MAAPISVLALLTRRSLAEFVDLGLEVATAVGLPVTSWRAGDPTRSYYSYLARVLDTLEGVAHAIARSAFLSTAFTEWLYLIAKEVYDVDVVFARPSTPQVTFDNTQAALHVIGVGELRVKATDTNATFVNLEAITIAPLETGVVIEMQAEVPGLASSIVEDQIDEIVTTYAGLEIVSSGASVGTDTQSNDSIIAQCRASLAALSPHGPSDIYEYVARNPDLTGVLDVNRAKSTDDSDTGDVIVYVASIDGPVSAPSLEAVQTALMEHATPWTVTVTAAQSDFVPINVVAEMDPLPLNAEEIFESQYGATLVEAKHGSLIAQSFIISELHRIFPGTKSVTVTTPATDLELDIDQIPVMGTVTITQKV